jgi:hypothetical protein
LDSWFATGAVREEVADALLHEMAKDLGFSGVQTVPKRRKKKGTGDNAVQDGDKIQRAKHAYASMFVTNMVGSAFRTWKVERSKGR